MRIQSITAVNVEQSALRLMSVDGEMVTVPWPTSTWHREYIEAWLAEGNAITPFAAPSFERFDPSPDNLGFTGTMLELLETF